MSQIKLTNKTANAMAEVKVEFLRALRGPGGVDIIVEEPVTTGVFDPITDTATEGVLTIKATTYSRSGLVIPLRSSEVDRNGGTGKSTFALGNELGDVPISQMLVLKIKTGVPLAESNVYVIGAQRYRFDRVVATASLGPRLPLWNLVSFRNA